MSRAKHELSLTNRDSYGGKTLTKIRKDIGCDYVVAGSYLAIGQAGRGRVRLDARVEDALTGGHGCELRRRWFLKSDLFNPGVSCWRTIASKAWG